MQSYLTLVRIKVSLLLIEVLVDIVTLHEFARNSAHKVNNNI
jgi:hypothetical protein